ncbi:MAG: tail fiber assembly protein [Parashewanella sp.]
MSQTLFSQKTLIDMEWASIRTKREQLLSATDWTQMADSPLSIDKKSEFAAYRKALRDLPQKESDPFTLIWPEKPA